MKVAVLLSTYNGEKYIREQLDSILNQTYKDISIIIRDDGSTDSTIDILKEYALNNQNIELYLGKNIGFLKGFYKLLEKAGKCDYYSYADQDDFWESTKIEKIIRKMRVLDESKPNMGFSYADYYDENLNYITAGPRIKNCSFRNSLVECCSQGMTMIINKTARDIIIKNKSENGFFHDQWTYMICSSMGEVTFVEEPLVRYRRLEESVTAEGKGWIEVMKWRFKKLLFEGGFKKFKTQILDFKKLFYKSPYLSKENKRLLRLFTRYYNPIYAIIKFLYPKRFRRKFTDEILVRILFLIGVL